MMEQTRGRVQADGHQLYYQRFGMPAPEVVLFLHHGLGSTRSWRRQIAQFTEAGFELLLYDRWGYGLSEPRSGFQTGFLIQGAEEAIEFLDALGLERVHIVGHSDGGTIGLLVAAGWPERVISLVVVAAHIYYEPKMLDGLRGIQANVSRPPLSTALEREHGERAQQLAQAWIEHWLQSDIHELSMQDRLDEITCPTLVIQGEFDEHATERHARDVAEGVRSGRLWLVPGAGHMPMHEAPELFNQVVIDFLRGQAGV
jgi:pimeloyl-ACP methyl ester carboxylesterase